MMHPLVAQELGPSALEEVEIRRMIDRAGEIGVLIIDANLDAVRSIHGSSGSSNRLACWPAGKPVRGAGRAVNRSHRIEVRVYYEDTDFSGAVYHAAYLHFFERGRTEFLRDEGVHHSELAKDGIAFAVRSM